MSYDAISWALEQRLDPVPRLVLTALGKCANKDGLAWPSVAWLAQFCGFHRTTIMRELIRLQRAQLIENTGERRGMTRQVKIWRLRMGEDSLPLELPESGRAKGRTQSDTSGRGSERGKCRSIGDTLNGLKGSLNGATLLKSERVALDNRCRERPVALDAGKGRTGATRNKSEEITYPLHAPAPAPAPASDRIFDAWNRMAQESGLSVSRTLTPDRRKQLSDRIAEHGAETILEAIGTVAASSFLTGDNARGWRADFDYFVSSRGMAKVVDGAFVDAGGKAKG